jgi:hypothetical protein
LSQHIANNHRVIHRHQPRHQPPSTTPPFAASHAINHRPLTTISPSNRHLSPAKKTPDRPFPTRQNGPRN